MPGGATSLTYDRHFEGQLRVISWSVTLFWSCFLLAPLLASCRMGFEPLADGGAKGDGTNRWDGSTLVDALPDEAPPSGICIAGNGVGQCPGICVGQRCDIDCSAAGSCTAAIACPAGIVCEIACGAMACTDVVCDLGSICNMNCNGVGSCNGAIICKLGSVCELTCRGQASCSGPIDCDGQCRINCSGAGSCATVDCRDACACDITCNSTACGSGATCPLPAACDTGLGCNNSSQCLASC